jgi:MoaA/NifB/PqqE/SkfB family radical SAM enzyme
LNLKLRRASRIAINALNPNKPHHAQWLITRKCNYRCRGCNVWKEQDQKELSTQKIKSGLEILKDMGIVDIVLSGGNPLLRDDAKEIINYSTERFITTVYDNGSMAGKKIEALRNVDFVAISIDSLDASKNDFIKNVPGAWKRAMNTVELLKREKINVCVTPTISQLNLYEIVDITKFFTERGIPVWYCLYSYDQRNDSDQLFRIGKPNDKLLIKDKEAMVGLFDTLIEMRKKNNNILITDKLLKVTRSLFSDEKRKWNCRALKSFLVIDHLGRIAGCHNQNFVGTVFDLPELWKNEKFKQLRKKYKNCSQCNYLCYIAYSLHGSPYGNLLIAKDHWKNAKVFFSNN